MYISEYRCIYLIEDRSLSRYFLTMTISSLYSFLFFSLFLFSSIIISAYLSNFVLPSRSERSTTVNVTLNRIGASVGFQMLEYLLSHSKY